MNYPLISEYIEAIKSAEDNFKELTNLRPVFNDDGQPIMTCGNFAVVFKMKDIKTGKFYALKCFTKEQEGRGEAYHQIEEELKDVESPYIISIRYLDKELFVDTGQTTETEFPVLLMEWVEGKTLDKYLRENIDDKFALEMLAYRFSQLAQWLIPQPFAHGDLKPDNILVCEDGTLVLIDYDGMYVPAMRGQKARELGSPDFRHPLRTEDDFDEHIDDFSLVSILLSLKALSLQPELLELYGASDRLLFSAKDYRNFSQCTLLDELFPSQQQEINLLIGQFALMLYYNNISCSQYNLVCLKKPHERYSRNYVLAKPDDFIDECGVHYSKDRKILIGVVDEWSFGNVYEIPEGTEIIQGGAFASSKANQLKCIVIPSSVRIIDILPGEFQIKCKSPYFKWYKNGLYTSDFKKLIYYPFIKETREIFLHPNTEKLSFGYGDYGEAAHPESCYQWQWHYYPTTVLYQCVPNIKFELSDNTILCVPKGTKELFVNLGYDIKQIIEGCVYIDEYGVVYSENKKELLTFPFGCNLEYYRIIDTCETIRDNAFKKHMREASYEDCYYIGNNLYTIILPDLLKNIGEKAFERCDFLESIIIPPNVEEIGDNAFSECIYLKSIIVDKRNLHYDSRDHSNAIIETKSNKLICGTLSTIIPDSVKVIGKHAFFCLEGLKKIIIPHGVEIIEERAFYGCKKLSTITFPNSVVSIGKEAFWGCHEIKSITIPDNVKEIGDNAFGECCNLSSIVVAKNNNIYDSRENCNAIIETDTNTLIVGCSSTIIPKSVKSIGNSAFCICPNLTSIIIPNNVKMIGDSVFEFCNSLTSVYLPDSITNMGKDVFYGCCSLRKIIIPEGTIEKFKRLLPENYHNLLVEEYGMNDVPF